MYASYNSFSHNINRYVRMIIEICSIVSINLFFVCLRKFRDAMVVTTLDTFTSLLAGITIFAILGNLAHELDVHVTEVIKSGGGTGLAFISYPEAIAKMEAVPWVSFINFVSASFHFRARWIYIFPPLSVSILFTCRAPFFLCCFCLFCVRFHFFFSFLFQIYNFYFFDFQLLAILFFFMLFVLGVGSLVAIQGSLTTFVMDAFPNWRKTYVSAGVALAGFLIGLIYVTPVRILYET